MINKKFSYAITACNEDKELNELLNNILVYADMKDSEIVILLDKNNYTKEVKKVVDRYRMFLPISVYYKALNKDFAAFKNYLNSKCKGHYIFNIDADEIPSYFLLLQLEPIVMAQMVEGLYLPRINTVEGITIDHIQKWNWHVNEKGYINWPDYQLRIYLNSPKIKWVGKVHETLTGFKENSVKMLPLDERYTLTHNKKISKQEQQNSFYETI